MNYRSFTAMSLAAAACVIMACGKEEQKNDGPSTLPDAKVTKVFEASSNKIESKNPLTNEWKTLTDTKKERKLAHEFTWEGDRLESMNDYNKDVFYSFNYDEKGRIVRIISDSDQDCSRTLFYNEARLLSSGWATERL